ncbi:RraA family protein [Paraburkholderia sartisoli]|uniref:Putative 4-hydroxy-4-methyl-2-oxoglutarate aldolase n=1 Tax=Paraburkholderia sartisoli TaxID=83784 RepID=A0A1H4GRZ0_9BURK|nr:RraA family protein [Paraburkholderia sartisoli]SEB12294.1 Regulator of RNase E activity RraA [Paraburkholderia sartisoli]
MTNSAISQLSCMDTTTISDALDKLGIAGQCLGIGPLDPACRLAGPAFTVRYMPCGVHGGTVGDYIDDLPEGTVIVLDNQQRLDATVWGDILTTVASRKRLGGTVIDGVCRDAPRAIDVKYPVFSRGSYMRTGKDRVAVDAVQCSVSIGGVRIDPGDLLVGDRDGVVAIPKARIEQVAEVAQYIDEAENHIRDAVERGERLDEVRKRQRYHSLQTRETS